MIIIVSLRDDNTHRMTAESKRLAMFIFVVSVAADDRLPNAINMDSITRTHSLTLTLIIIALIDKRYVHLYST